MIGQAEKDLLLKELDFKAIRSSGAGGQHVNKVASKVELSFDLANSLVLNEDQKELISKNLASRLTKDKVLMLQCGESRSQHKNKSLVVDRFFEILNEALVVPTERKETKVPKAVVKKRLKKKRIKSEKKANRKPPQVDG